MLRINREPLIGSNAFSQSVSRGALNTAVLIVCKRHANCAAANQMTRDYSRMNKIESRKASTIGMRTEYFHLQFQNFPKRWANRPTDGGLFDNNRIRQRETRHNLFA